MDEITIDSDELEQRVSIYLPRSAKIYRLNKNQFIFIIVMTVVVKPMFKGHIFYLIF